MYFADCIENDVVLVTIVWPAIALLWEGMLEYIGTFNLDKFHMVLYGYLMALLLQTLIKEIVETFIELNKCSDDPDKPCNELLRILTEDLYVFFAVATTITIWLGELVG